MATLSVWKFNDPSGADGALEKLQDMQRRQLIQVLDAATVSWPADAKKPKTRQLHSTAAAGALGGAFWGMLFGLLFFIPFIGLAIGAATGALMGAFTDVGIDDKFINETREKITPGTSGLFLMSENAVVDKVAEEFKGTEFELISTNLSPEEEQKLKDAFAEG